MKTPFCSLHRSPIRTFTSTYAPLPRMHSLPMTAPSRTWTWLQILVFGPTSAPSETSAVGWMVTWSRERTCSDHLLAGLGAAHRQAPVGVFHSRHVDVPQPALGDQAPIVCCRRRPAGRVAQRPNDGTRPRGGLPPR